jgi:hypothetical protein
MDEKVQKQVNTWSRLNLSLTGRINIAKTMMYSQLNYNGCFLPPCVHTLQSIENKIIKFVLGKSGFSRERVFKSTKEGGLGIFPIKEFLGAQQCTWILRSRSMDEMWKIALSRYFNNLLTTSGLNF